VRGRSGIMVGEKPKSCLPARSDHPREKGPTNPGPDVKQFKPKDRPDVERIRNRKAGGIQIPPCQPMRSHGLIYLEARCPLESKEFGCGAFECPLRRDWDMTAGEVFGYWSH
jgi:hypothetical protein